MGEWKYWQIENVSKTLNVIISYSTSLFQFFHSAWPHIYNYIRGKTTKYTVKLLNNPLWPKILKCLKMKKDWGWKKSTTSSSIYVSIKPNLFKNIKKYPHLFLWDFDHVLTLNTRFPQSIMAAIEGCSKFKTQDW